MESCALAPVPPKASASSGGRKTPDFDILELACRRDGVAAQLTCRPRTVLFRQGEPADSLFYLLAGKIKLSAVSEYGKECVLAILPPQSFFGESCLIGRPIRRMSATAMTESEILRIDAAAAEQMMMDCPAFSAFLIRNLISNELRAEDALIDHLLNSSERRLARLLLMLSNHATAGTPEVTLPSISQETLAEMVGTTRSRVNQFMNAFRRHGHITYDGRTITVRESLSRVIQNSPQHGGGE
ncbi:cAMP receptor protein [Methyloligella halotolerans]|uniref:cAMP receptor protein n=1 Tax=Methyloligella halotolerans TaxID=1177755 RepID=A0A1E2RZU3_9HYPH|nr:Crp/Fnr family transcriptional regulator [Methyloligella halotolerans]ODA67731.1 cAMP receptor protein [Methyloligella halotolerans]